MPTTSLLLAAALLFPAQDLGGIAALTEGTATVPPAILLESASWLNQVEPAGGPIEVKVSARSFDQAQRLGKGIVAALTPRVNGDASRIRSVADVRPDAPVEGTVAINAALGSAGGSAKARD